MDKTTSLLTGFVTIIELMVILVGVASLWLAFLFYKQEGNNTGKRCLVALFGVAGIWGIEAGTRSLIGLVVPQEVILILDAIMVLLGFSTIMFCLFLVLYNRKREGPQ